MTTCCSLTFTTTVRVIDRVHDHTTHCRANTAPAHCTSFTNLAQVVLAVADFTDRCTAFDVNAAHFAGTQANLSVGAFACHQHNAGAGGTSDLGTLARQHFHAVDSRTDRNVADRQSITSLDRRFRTTDQLIADSNALRSDDVLAFAVRIAQQSNVRSTVRVVFDTLDLGDDTVLVATEVDNAVMLLVAATDMTGGDVTVVVTTSGLGLLFDQGGKRRPLYRSLLTTLTIPRRPGEVGLTFTSAII